MKVANLKELSLVTQALAEYNKFLTEQGLSIILVCDGAMYFKDSIPLQKQFIDDLILDSLTVPINPFPLSGG